MARYESLKDDLVVCDGERPGGFPCRGQLYRCTKCGHTGCQQNKEHLCTKQGFNLNFRCYACGAVGMVELIASGHRQSKSAASSPARLAS